MGQLTTQYSEIRVYVNGLLSPVVSAIVARQESIIEAFGEDMTALFKEAEAEILTENQFESRVTLVKKMRKMVNLFDETRKDMFAPLSEKIKEGKARVDECLIPVNERITMIDAANKGFLAKKRREQEEAEAAARRQDEGLRKAQQTRREKGMTVKPDVALPTAIAPIAFEQRTSVTVKKIRKWRITDFRAVPDAYLHSQWMTRARSLFDGPRILAEAKEGRTVSGIEFYTEDQL